MNENMATIDIYCEDEVSKIIVTGDVYRDEVFHFSVPESRARLIGEIMAMRGRDLLDMTLEELQAERLKTEGAL